MHVLRPTSLLQVENDFVSQEERFVIIEASLKTMENLCVLDGEVDLNMFAAKIKDAKSFELRPLVGTAYAVALAEQLRRDFKAHYGVFKILTLTMAHLDSAWNNIKQLRPSGP
ncbi:hypothetical protein N665_0030s0070 [Sinapis alba]|nr:hypothetical protein N665_0030s0070 [Sinapis alba]